MGWALGTSRLVPVAMRVLRAATAADLALMASELHDSWIELPAQAEFRVPQPVHLLGTLEFGDVRCLRSWGPFVRVEEMKPRIELTVENVTSVSLEDAAEIGVVDVARMRFDEALGQMLIEGNIPASIVLKVASLEVRVVVTDEIVDRRERWRLRSRLPAGTADAA